MKQYPNLKAVLFDFGGTLDADGIAWKEQFFPLYQKEGFTWSPEEYAKYFYASDDYLTEKTLTALSYSKTIHLQVGLLLKAAQVFDKKLASKIAKAYLKGTLANLKKNIPLLRNLKKKYKLGVISNFYGNLPAIFREIGYDKIFDTVIDSNRVGHTKPDRQIFEAALKKLKVKPEECLLVGDSYKRDMLGAKAMGIDHILVISAEAKAWQTCCSEDRTIQSVRDLKGILL